MVKYENECVGCPPEMGCLGSACDMRHVAHYYCDKCGYEVEELYDVNGEQLCEDCRQEVVDEMFPKLTDDELLSDDV